eukprot:NODE_3297_length_790_cov_87.153846_g2754_i0.p1 GENE.NODE_3297_length_790_cov_87.153846_g2754_i0~~NODE_3297_length_790_cov_87.153846_g2754_i0.p1  ORF type:complete len:148 (-),score=31.57 NODE_3297_length_790_cov_87.153846_g2754_i0:148-591(-)
METDCDILKLLVELQVPVTINRRVLHRDIITSLTRKVFSICLTDGVSKIIARQGNTPCEDDTCMMHHLFAVMKIKHVWMAKKIAANGSRHHTAQTAWGVWSGAQGSEQLPQADPAFVFPVDKSILPGACNEDEGTAVFDCTEGGQHT